jgi:hypothetical protein
MRYTAFPECQCVYTVLALEEVPLSRHVTRLVRARDSIIDNFRSSVPEAMDEGAGEGPTLSHSSSASSLLSRSVSGSSLTGGAGGGRGEGEGAATWPLTLLGQPLDHQRMAAIVQAERASPQLLASLFEPPPDRASDVSAASGGDREVEGQGGGGEWPPWVGEEREGDLTAGEEEQAQSAMEEGAGDEDEM